MANCKRCDRCRSYYEESDTFKKDIPKITKDKVKGFEATLLYSLAGNRIDFGKIDIHAKNGNWLGPIDLCPSCGEEFCTWLMNEEDADGKQGAEKTKKKT